MSVTVRVVADEADLKACYALRFEVFVDEQGVSAESEIDAEDAGATHLLLLEDAVPIGTLRILRDGDTARIGRVCLRASARGRGLGAALMRRAIAVIEEDRTVARIKLSAQVTVVGFYEGLGFTAYGPLYDDERIPHQAMERQLAPAAG